MGLNDEGSTEENPPPPERKLSARDRKLSACERKLSTSERRLSASEGSRVRTRSFGERSKIHIVREYVGDDMDKYLLNRNKVKKAIARDSSSIFRAVCEQLSSVQTDYQDLRVLVEQMLRPIAQKHFKEGTQFERDVKIFEILADLTNSRIFVYTNTTDEPVVYEGTEIENDREVHVSVNEQYRSVYEPVFDKERHEALAISQSVVYRMLYEGVFGNSKELVDGAVRYIRADIDKHSHTTLDELCMGKDEHLHSANVPCMMKPPRFPFCVCKSLDPAIYRNVEFDLYKRKSKESEQAAQNSLAVKFGVGARCLARDGGVVRNAKVTAVVKNDVRRVVFEDAPKISREFDVSDLRPLPSSTVAHHSMQTLMNRTGAGGGGQHPMQFLPGCFPHPPMFPPMPPRTSAGCMPPMLPPIFFGGPPPPPWMNFAPSPVMVPTGQQRFSFGSHEIVQAPPPPPPSPMDRSMCNSPPPAESTLDSFTATPLSSRKGEDGRRSNIKPRSLSLELADSPVATRQKTEQLRLKDDGDKTTGGRRATEGDTVGEMNRPLQPKKQQQLSSIGSSAIDNEFPPLPSMDTSVQQQQQLQQDEEKAAAAAYRANLPSLFPLPPNQARTSYYTSSEWTGDDNVFTADEGNASQMNLSNANNRDSRVSSSSDAIVGMPSNEEDGCRISCPFINIQQYNKVRKDANYSKKQNGKDLPDILTTRFFYNLGVQFYRDNIRFTENGEIMHPPPDAIPMPPFFFAPSPSLPPNSPTFFPANFTMGQLPALPPITPAVFIPTSMPPYLAQYYHPGVDGMPPYGFGMDDGNSAMVHHVSMSMTSVQSPSPLIPQGNFFFPPN